MFFMCSSEMFAVVCLKTKASEALASNNGQQLIFCGVFLNNATFLKYHI